jgi:hypothetical protein
VPDLVGALENTSRTTFVLDFSADQMFYFALLQIFMQITNVIRSQSTGMTLVMNNKNK